MNNREAQFREETYDLIATGRALADGLRAWDLTGHELHGLRPWRTCRMCWRMSVFVFIEMPLSRRWFGLRHWLRPVVVRATRQNFVTREWRWTRLAVSQRELWALARLRNPHGPWIARDTLPLFWHWDANGGRLPDNYETMP